MSRTKNLQRCHATVGGSGKISTFKVDMKKVHLTREQKYTISAMYKHGCTQKMIALAIGQIGHKP